MNIINDLIEFILIALNFIVIIGAWQELVIMFYKKTNFGRIGDVILGVLSALILSLVGMLGLTYPILILIYSLVWFILYKINNK